MECQITPEGPLRNAGLLLDFTHGEPVVQYSHLVAGIQPSFGHYISLIDW